MRAVAGADDAELNQQAVQIGDALLTPEIVQTDRSLPIADGGKPGFAGFKQDLTEDGAVGLINQDRDQRRRIDDDHFGNPSSS